MADRITAVKKSSLDGLSEGWGPECYAIVTPADYTDMLALDAVKTGDKTAQIEYQRDLVARHFVAGKIKVWHADGTQVLEDMTVEDVSCSVAVLDRLFADIIGLDLDPKDLRRTVAHEMTPLSDAPNTETPSSTATPPNSDPTSPES